MRGAAAGMRAIGSSAGRRGSYGVANARVMPEAAPVTTMPPVARSIAELQCNGAQPISCTLLTTTDA